MSILQQLRDQSIKITLSGSTLKTSPMAPAQSRLLETHLTEVLAELMVEQAHARIAAQSQAVHDELFQPAARRPASGRMPGMTDRPGWHERKPLFIERVMAEEKLAKEAKAKKEKELAMKKKKP